MFCTPIEPKSTKIHQNHLITVSDHLKPSQNHLNGLESWYFHRRWYRVSHKNAQRHKQCVLHPNWTKKHENTQKPSQNHLKPSQTMRLLRWFWDGLRWFWDGSVMILGHFRVSEINCGAKHIVWCLWVSFVVSTVPPEMKVASLETVEMVLRWSEMVMRWFWWIFMFLRPIGMQNTLCGASEYFCG